MRIITGLISSKAIAYFVGPSGMALMGNFRNFNSTLESIGILGFQNGIVKTIAEKQTDINYLKGLICTVFYTLLIVSILLGSVVLLSSNYFLKSILDNNESYKLAIQIVAITLPFSILHLFFISVINGFCQYQKVVAITIFSYIIGLVVSVFLMWKFGVLGAMISISVLSFLLFCMSGYYFHKIFSFTEILNFHFFELSQIKKIIVLASMTLFSSIVTPVIYIFIRKLIIINESIEAAGYFEAMNRISGFYMMFVTTLVSLYYLPEFSKSKNIIDNKPMIVNYFKTIIPILLFSFIVLFFMKDFVVLVLFSKDFSNVSEMFIWQLIGDFFRACALILAIQFFAKKMVRPYFITEIISFSILLISNYFCILYFGAKGAVIAYAITYILYFIVLSFYFRIFLKLL